MSGVSEITGMAATVDQRMRELRMNATELIDKSGLSAGPVRRLRRGLDYRYDATTIMAFCDALGWRDDAIDRMRAGEPPVLKLVVHEGGADRSPVDEALETARQAMQIAETAGSVAAANRAMLEGLVNQVELVVEKLDSIEQVLRGWSGRDDPADEQAVGVAP